MSPNTFNFLKVFCLFVHGQVLSKEGEKNAYSQKLCLELLGESVSYEFQAFHSVRGKGGVWQGDGAQAGPVVILGAAEIWKWL